MTNQPRYHPPLGRQKSGPSEVSLIIKYTLFALNVLFWLFGLVMVLIGVYAKSEKAYGGIGSALPWFMDPANLFIIVGAIIFTLAFLGCIGSLRENIALLKSFEYTIDILLLLEIALAIYVFVDKKKVKNNVEGVLKKTIPKYRDDVDFQSIIDWTQENMKCCGISDDTDWDLNIYFNCTRRKYPNPERCGVPFSCCKNYKTELNRQCGYKMREKENEDIKDSKIYTRGCVDAALSYLLNEESLVLLVCVAGAVVLLQLVTTGLAHHLVDGIRRQKSRWDNRNNFNPAR